MLILAPMPIIAIGNGVGKISYSGDQNSSVVKDHKNEHGSLFDFEVESYKRLQTVVRPQGCENMMLFPQMYSHDPKKKTVTLQRFGKTIECKCEKNAACCEPTCCETMCDLLPVHGELGLCQQLSCIAAVLHLANITHLDTNPKNMLFGSIEDDANGRSGNGLRHGEVVLYDFDVVAIPSHATAGGAREDFEFQVPRNLHKQFNLDLATIGGVLSRLLRCATVGYLPCAGPPKEKVNNDTVWTTTPSNVNCPFEATLRKMLPRPGVLTAADLLSLKTLSEQGPIKRTPGCYGNGDLPYTSKRLHPAMEEALLHRNGHPRLIGEMAAKGASWKEEAAKEWEANLMAEKERMGLKGKTERKQYGPIPALCKRTLPPSSTHPAGSLGLIEHGGLPDAEKDKKDKLMGKLKILQQNKLLTEGTEFAMSGAAYEQAVQDIMTGSDKL